VIVLRLPPDATVASTPITRASAKSVTPRFLTPEHSLAGRGDGVKTRVAGRAVLDV